MLQIWRFFHFSTKNLTDGFEFVWPTIFAPLRGQFFTLPFLDSQEFFYPLTLYRNFDFLSLCLSDFLWAFERGQIYFLFISTQKKRRNSTYISKVVRKKALSRFYFLPKLWGSKIPRSSKKINILLSNFDMGIGRIRG